MRAFIVRPHKLLLAAAVAIPLILFCLMMWHGYSSLLYDGIFFGVAVIVLSILAVAVNRHAKSEQAATEALKAVNCELSAAHEQAENKKQLLEAVMKALPIGLAITDTQGGTIESNSAFEQIWGGPRPKTLSVEDYSAYRAWWADTGEPVGPDEWASAKAVKNGETVVGQMMRLERFDGSETFVINSASPVRDAEGRIVGSAVAIQDISEIKKIDDELRVAKEEWERTFDSVPDLIAILDNQHRIVRVNQAMANQLNLEPSQCVGLPCYKAIHGTNVPPSFCPHSRSLDDLEEHESLVEETVFGGTFLVSTTPLFNRDDEMYASVHVARDITRLSQIEKELRENEERLRLLGDNLPESAVYQYAHELDGSVRFLYLSAGIEQLNGISVEALLQDAGKLYRQIAPEYLAQFLEAEAKSARELSDLDMEVPMHRPDGEMRWMRLHSRPRRFPDGRIVWDGVQTDITGRKQAESLLREKDARLQFHLDNSPMAVIEWDSDFTVLSWTGESEQLFGWSAAEAVGKPFTALQMVVEEDMSIVAATMARLTDGVTRQVVLTNRNYTKKGDIRHCTWYNSVLMNQEGRISSIMSQVIDITERIAVENELLQARNELEERVRERTQALEAAVEILHAETEQRLQAVETLRRQELVLIQQSRHAAMGEMIGNIAHQWRQPLNTLGLFTQRLGVFYGSAEFNKEFLDTTVAKCMEIIQYMSRTIDDFRSFFSTDREKTEFSIDGAVTKALSLVEAGFRERMIRVEREKTEDVKIYGFPNEYAQVLLNIFINAKDAINERNVKSPLVKINIATLDGSSLLTISDNSGGIPEDIMDKIFDPYFSTKGPQQGTGLGLFMSKTIIENNMGGRLTVRNSDEGAEFRIEV